MRSGPTTITSAHLAGHWDTTRRHVAGTNDAASSVGHSIIEVFGLCWCEGRRWCWPGSCGSLSLKLLRTHGSKEGAGCEGRYMAASGARFRGRTACCARNATSFGWLCISPAPCLRWTSPFRWLSSAFRGFGLGGGVCAGEFSGAFIFTGDICHTRRYDTWCSRRFALAVGLRNVSYIIGLGRSGLLIWLLRCHDGYVIVDVSPVWLTITSSASQQVD